ncbi:hypothetical protein OGATHE_006555 [Ogataea polymorpha]|uniref:Uncharacterized protein n=1 Tax=Ogataea polymorpha TaxID=460523 RepID=A0A9P8NTJ1_9ASCO|nr:hypothetical protein OGATHE_006555 [Ogataea polymorpha]
MTPVSGLMYMWNSLLDSIKANMSLACEAKEIGCKSFSINSYNLASEGSTMLKTFLEATWVNKDSLVGTLERLSNIESLLSFLLAKSSTLEDEVTGTDRTDSNCKDA